jgi:hypothetical protein
VHGKNLEVRSEKLEGGRQKTDDRGRKMSNIEFSMSNVKVKKTKEDR